MRSFTEHLSEAPVSYTGVMLDSSSHDALLARMREHIPSGWKTYAHHMTAHMGAAKDRGEIGKKVTLVADAWAADDKTVTVRVSGYPSKNKTPHITVAVNTGAGAKPKDSNLHTQWTVMPSLRLTGTVGEA